MLFNSISYCITILYRINILSLRAVNALLFFDVFFLFKFQTYWFFLYYSLNGSCKHFQNFQNWSWNRSGGKKRTPVLGFLGLFHHYPRWENQTEVHIVKRIGCCWLTMFLLQCCGWGMFSVIRLAMLVITDNSQSYDIPIHKQQGCFAR